MVNTHGLSHIALAVADPERSLAFYRAVFGVRAYFRDSRSIYYLISTRRWRRGILVLSGVLMLFLLPSLAELCALAVS